MLPILASGGCFTLCKVIQLLPVICHNFMVARAPHRDRIQVLVFRFMRFFGFWYRHAVGRREKFPWNHVFSVISEG